jgi:hypothetical protein
MFESSMMLTIGAALDRAQVEGLLVQISVSGQWIPGRVVNTDQHGVAFLEASGDMCVFRPESIAGVRMPQRSHGAHHHRPTASQRAPIEAHAVAVD